MKNKKKALILFSLPLITLSALCTACNTVYGSSEQVQNGAYYATGRGEEYAVIYGNYMSLFWNHENDRCDVVKFSRNGDSYTGKSIRAEISFKISGDKMTVRLTSTGGLMVKNKRINLKRNPSFVLSETEPMQLPPPLNVSCSSYAISWREFEGGKVGSNTHKRGILGAGVEIKYAGTENFRAVKIRDFTGGPYWYFDIYFPDLYLPQGTHILRIRHIGGPFVNDKKEIGLSLDSLPLYFKVTAGSNGNIISAEEIFDEEPTEPIQNGAYYANGTVGESAVIYEDYISLFWGGERLRDVFKFSKEGDFYTGKNIHAEISFKFSEDYLTVFITSSLGIAADKRILFKRNPSIRLSKEGPIQLSPREIVEYYFNSINDSYIRWAFKKFPSYEPPFSYFYKNWILGVGVEIKYAGAEDFAAVNISNCNMYDTYAYYNINFQDLGLTQGTHILRIRHIGGPFVNDKKEIGLSLDSLPLYFKVTAGSNGKIDAEEISE